MELQELSTREVFWKKKPYKLLSICLVDTEARGLLSSVEIYETLKAKNKYWISHLWCHQLNCAQGALLFFLLIWTNLKIDLDNMSLESMTTESPLNTTSVLGNGSSQQHLTLAQRLCLVKIPSQFEGVCDGRAYQISAVGVVLNMLSLLTLRKMKFNTEKFILDEMSGSFWHFIFAGHVHSSCCAIFGLGSWIWKSFHNWISLCDVCWIL